MIRRRICQQWTSTPLAAGHLTHPRAHFSTASSSIAAVVVVVVANTPCAATQQQKHSKQFGLPGLGPLFGCPTTSAALTQKRLASSSTTASAGTKSSVGGAGHKGGSTIGGANSSSSNSNSRRGVGRSSSSSASPKRSSNSSRGLFCECLGAVSDSAFTESVADFISHQERSLYSVFRSSSSSGNGTTAPAAAQAQQHRQKTSATSKLENGEFEEEQPPLKPSGGGCGGPSSVSLLRDWPRLAQCCVAHRNGTAAWRLAELHIEELRKPLALSPPAPSASSDAPKEYYCSDIDADLMDYEAGGVTPRSSSSLSPSAHSTSSYLASMLLGSSTADSVRGLLRHRACALMAAGALKALPPQQAVEFLEEHLIRRCTSRTGAAAASSPKGSHKKEVQATRQRFPDGDGDVLVATILDAIRGKKKKKNDERRRVLGGSATTSCRSATQHTGSKNTLRVGAVADSAASGPSPPSSSSSSSQTGAGGGAMKTLSSFMPSIFATSTTPSSSSSGKSSEEEVVGVEQIVVAPAAASSSKTIGCETQANVEGPSSLEGSIVDDDDFLDFSFVLGQPCVAGAAAAALLSAGRITGVSATAILDALLVARLTDLPSQQVDSELRRLFPPPPPDAASASSNSKTTTIVGGDGDFNVGCDWWSFEAIVEAAMVPVAEAAAAGGDSITVTRVIFAAFRHSGQLALAHGTSAATTTRKTYREASSSSAATVAPLPKLMRCAVRASLHSTSAAATGMTSCESTDVRRSSTKNSGGQTSASASLQQSSSSTSSVLLPSKRSQLLAGLSTLQSLAGTNGQQQNQQTRHKPAGPDGSKTPAGAGAGSGSGRRVRSGSVQQAQVGAGAGGGSSAALVGPMVVEVIDFCVTQMEEILRAEHIASVHHRHQQQDEAAEALRRGTTRNNKENYSSKKEEGREAARRQAQLQPPKLKDLPDMLLQLFPATGSSPFSSRHSNNRWSSSAANRRAGSAEQGGGSSASDDAAARRNTGTFSDAATTVVVVVDPPVAVVEGLVRLEEARGKALRAISDSSSSLSSSSSAATSTSTSTSRTSPVSLQGHSQQHSSSSPVAVVLPRTTTTTTGPPAAFDHAPSSECSARVVSYFEDYILPTMPGFPAAETYRSYTDVQCEEEEDAVVDSSSSSSEAAVLRLRALHAALRCCCNLQVRSPRRGALHDDHDDDDDNSHHATPDDTPFRRCCRMTVRFFSPPPTTQRIAAPPAAAAAAVGRSGGGGGIMASSISSLFSGFDQCWRTRTSSASGSTFGAAASSGMHYHHNKTQQDVQGGGQQQSATPDDDDVVMSQLMSLVQNGRVDAATCGLLAHAALRDHRHRVPNTVRHQKDEQSADEHSNSSGGGALWVAELFNACPTERHLVASATHMCRAYSTTAAAAAAATSSGEEEAAARRSASTDGVGLRALIGGVLDVLDTSSSPQTSSASTVAEYHDHDEAGKDVNGYLPFVSGNKPRRDMETDGTPMDEGGITDGGGKQSRRSLLRYALSKEELSRANDICAFGRAAVVALCCDLLSSSTSSGGDRGRGRAGDTGAGDAAGGGKEVAEEEPTLSAADGDETAESSSAALLSPSDVSPLLAARVAYCALTGLSPALGIPPPETDSSPAGSSSTSFVRSIAVGGWEEKGEYAVEEGGGVDAPIPLLPRSSSTTPSAFVVVAASAIRHVLRHNTSSSSNHGHSSSSPSAAVVGSSSALRAVEDAFGRVAAFAAAKAEASASTPRSNSSMMKGARSVASSHPQQQQSKQPMEVTENVGTEDTTTQQTVGEPSSSPTSAEVTFVLTLPAAMELIRSSFRSPSPSVGVGVGRRSTAASSTATSPHNDLIGEGGEEELVDEAAEGRRLLASWLHERNSGRRHGGKKESGRNNSESETATAKGNPRNRTRSSSSATAAAAAVPYYSVFCAAVPHCILLLEPDNNTSTTSSIGRRTPNQQQQQQQQLWSLLRSGASAPRGSSASSLAAVNATEPFLLSAITSALLVQREGNVSPSPSSVVEVLAWSEEDHHATATATTYAPPTNNRQRSPAATATATATAAASAKRVTNVSLQGITARRAHGVISSLLHRSTTSSSRPIHKSSGGGRDAAHAAKTTFGGTTTTTTTAAADGTGSSTSRRSSSGRAAACRGARRGSSSSTTASTSTSAASRCTPPRGAGFGSPPQH